MAPARLAKTPNASPAAVSQKLASAQKGSLVRINTVSVTMSMSKNAMGKWIRAGCSACPLSEARLLIIEFDIEASDPKYRLRSEFGK